MATFAHLIPEKGRFDDLIPEEPSGVAEIPSQVVGGFSEATANTAKMLESLVPLGSVGIKDEFPFLYHSKDPDYWIGDQPETMTGGITRNISKFLTYFIPGMRLVAPVKGGVVGKALAAEGTAVASEQLAFQPEEERLSNLIESVPELQNPVTEYLSADPEDSEAEGRFKMGLESTGLAALTAPLFYGVRGFKLAKQGKAKKAAADLDKAESLAPKEFRDVAPADIIKDIKGEKAANIRLDKHQISDEAKNVAKNVADIGEDRITKARRGVVSDEQAKAAAEEIGLDDLMTRKTGQAFNAEQIVKLRNAFAQSAEDLRMRAQAAAKGADEDVVQFDRALSHHVALQEQVSGVTAEAGRALRVFRQDVGLAPEMKDIIEKFGGRDFTQDLAGKIGAINDLNALNKFTRESFKPGFGDKALELWYNALLSGPTTHAVNTLSNTLVAAMTIPEQAIAGAFGALRRSDRVFMRETSAKMAGMVQGALDGLDSARRTFVTETPSDLMAKIDIPHKTAIGGKLGRMIRIPGRALMAEDEFFKSAGYRMELNALAVREGMEKGLSGKALKQHMADVVKDPSEKMMRAALHQARVQTFTNPLGPAMQKFMTFANHHKSMRLLFPFIRTPTNIVKYALERTPVALPSALKKTGAARDLALAKVSFGTGLMGLVYNLAQEGHITGGGPKDQRDKASKLAAGWQPYSIKVGGGYYGYNRLEPMGMLFGMSADLTEGIEQYSNDEIDGISGVILKSIVNNLTSKTWLRGLSEAIRAIDDPDRYGNRFVQGYSGTIIPTAAAQIARLKDPTLRRRDTIPDAIKARIPGVSEGLLPKLDMWGEPIQLEGGLGPDIVSPIYKRTISKDPVRLMMSDLKIKSSTPSKMLMIGRKNIKLTPEQHNELISLSGKLAKTILDQVVTAEGFDRLPDDVKRKVVGDVISRGRDYGRAAMRARLLSEDPDMDITRK